MLMTRLKSLFSGPRAWPVECFGKLPCYQDYVSLVTSRGATRWRDWLLSTYRGETLPPEGVWRFVFESQQHGEPVVGLIQASSDGRREFPFSLFVVGDPRLLRSPAALTAVWEELAALHWQLIAVPDIQGIYTCCAGRKVSLDPAAVSEKEAQTLRPDSGRWPRLLVAAPGNGGALQLLWQAGMEPAALDRNWQALKV